MSKIAYTTIHRGGCFNGWMVTDNRTTGRLTESCLFCVHLLGIKCTRRHIVIGVLMGVLFDAFVALVRNVSNLIFNKLSKHFVYRPNADIILVWLRQIQIAMNQPHIPRTRIRDVVIRHKLRCPDWDLC